MITYFGEFAVIAKEGHLKKKEYGNSSNFSFTELSFARIFREWVSEWVLSWWINKWTNGEFELVNQRKVDVGSCE
jgi:hypothetical protein